MIKSLYSGVTGLKSHNQRMDVIGNNIANVNTTAFKAGTVTFKDVYYQTRQRASAGDFTTGGVNPVQIGMGVQLGTIGKVMSQSGLTYSDSVFDCALEGSGFFQVMDSMGNVFYTRLGRFSLDDFGNLVDANGNVVLGITGDPTGRGAGQERINIQIPDVPDQRASAFRSFFVGRDEYNIVIRAGDFGPGGNIGLSIAHSSSPFATMSGANGLLVLLDLTKDYQAIAESNVLRASFPATPAGQAQYEQAIIEEISELFAADLNEAIRIGGVNVDPSLLPLTVDFGSVPTVTAAQNANNTRNIPGTDYSIEFEVTAPGASGNRYEVSMTTVAGTGAVTAQWRGNVLEVRLPADRDVSIEEINTRIASAGRNPASTPGFYGVYEAGDPEVLTGDALVGDPKPAAFQPIIVVRGGGQINLPVDNPARFWNNDPADPDYVPTLPDGLVNRSTLPPTHPEYYDSSTPARINDGTGLMIDNPAYIPPTVPGPVVNAITTAGFPSGTPVRVGMRGGENSFFQTAFTSLSTVQLTGGMYQGPQTPDTAEIFIDRDGIIYGEHPVHGMLLLGRIDIVDFVNPEGLRQVGTSYYAETLNSGPPNVRIPQSESETFIISGALEMSNVDLSNEFSDMIITQRGFQANSRIITVSDSMLEELVNLKR